MAQEYIQEWINRLEPPSDSSSLPKPAAPNAARKRKARSSYSLASPPLSYREGDDDYNMASTPQKRRRLESQGGIFDPDTTPRRGSRSIPSSSTSFSAPEDIVHRDRGSYSKSRLIRSKVQITVPECRPLVNSL